MVKHRAEFTIEFEVKEDMGLRQTNRGQGVPDYHGWCLTKRQFVAHDVAMPWLMSTVNSPFDMRPGDHVHMKIHREIDADAHEVNAKGEDDDV